MNKLVRRTLVPNMRRLFSGDIGAPGVPKKGFFRQGPVSWASFAMCVVVCSGSLIFFQIEKDKKIMEQTKKVETTGKAAIGGEWVLTNSNGIPITDAHYHNQFSLLYFGFTYCPDICPNELIKIGKVLDQLNEKIKAQGLNLKYDTIKPVFVSVDPNRDTIQQLKHYSKDFDSRIDWLTGTTEQVQNICKAFRVYFSKANQHEEDEDDYLVDHSIVLYLIGPNNEFIEFYTQRMLINEIVDKIIVQLKGHSGNKA